MLTNPQKTRYELTVDLIKALAWPVFAFFMLFSFWKPLHLAMNQLPEIVSQSDTITIASLTLKIDRGLQSKGLEPSSEVRDVLSKLSPGGIERILEVSSSSWYTSESDAESKAANMELVNLGLLTLIPPEELTKDGKNYAYGVRITALGKETQSYLYAIISEFVKELEQPTSPQNVP